MKLMNLIITCALIIELVSADMLRRRTNSTSTVITTNLTATTNSTARVVAHVGIDLNDSFKSECELIRDEETCNPLEQCGWIDGRCQFKTTDGCGRWMEESTCDSLADCVWVSDARDTRPGASGKCLNKENVINNGNCAAQGFVIRSESACNSIKACSWFGDGDSSYCSVALTQLECDSFQDKNTCKQMGCLSKREKRKKSRICFGRWEYQFLSTLKKMNGIEAKEAIEEEFGEETYTVVLINPGVKDKKAIKKGKDRERIKLHLNKAGNIRKTPRFG